MKLRDAITGDAAQIADIWNPIIAETTVTFTTQLKTEAALQQEIMACHAAGHVFVVAEKAGQVLGFARYAPFRAGPGYARTMEHTVFVAQNARGSGIGRQLLEGIEERARASGVHALIGGVSAENQAAVLFHRTMGYSCVGTLPEVGFKFGRFIDLIFLQKRVGTLPDNSGTKG